MTQGEFAAIFNLACTAREPDAMAMPDYADFEMCPKKTHFGHAGQNAEITMRTHESLSLKGSMVFVPMGEKLILGFAPLTCGQSETPSMAHWLEGYEA